MQAWRRQEAQVQKEILSGGLSPNLVPFVLNILGYRTDKAQQYPESAGKIIKGLNGQKIDATYSSNGMETKTSVCLQKGHATIFRSKLRQLIQG